VQDDSWQNWAVREAVSIISSEKDTEVGALEPKSNGDNMESRAGVHATYTENVETEEEKEFDASSL